MEAVRLVIWDLDETFWQGTLTEGGMTYRQDCHDMVVTLAKRGILSTICSKNDFGRVRAILEERGIWEYFIFPSIDWEAKGPRIAALVETVQLRAPTIMLIDDNPMNLNEARHFVPELQTESDAFIAGLLDDPRFRGKDDAGMTRLAQYKLMERRHADEVAATTTAGTNYDFLRGSNIRVRFQFDLEPHIDRVVELINRTNQLNFTKARLPEDPEEARAAARALLSGFDVQAALIRVTDDYGDYGYCGLYVMKSRPPRSWLVQFAFSCRILNMGVEHWVYRHLGRPRLDVSGEVLSDVTDDSIPADWITTSEFGQEADASAAGFALERVVIKGGCDLTAVGHYFGLSSRVVAGEFNTARAGLQIRSDHSHILRMTIDGVSPDAMRSLEKLGYRAEDFATEVFDEGNDLVILGFAIDASLPTYRHKALGYSVGFRMPGSGGGNRQEEAAPVKKRMNPHAEQALADATAELEANYELEGVVPEAVFRDNLVAVLQRIPSSVRVFVLGANEHWENPKKGKRVELVRHKTLNRAIRDVVKDFTNVSFIASRDFVQSEDEVEGTEHFKRMVYYRIYKHVLGASTSSPTGDARADAVLAG